MGNSSERARGMNELSKLRIHIPDSYFLICEYLVLPSQQRTRHRYPVNELVYRAIKFQIYIP